MSTPNNTDLLLVERGGSQYKLPYSDLNNKLDTDVFLVERDGVQYKVLGEFIGGSSVGTVSAAPVLSDDNDSRVPAVITLTNATVGNATLASNVWFKDGVVITGVTGSTYSATDPGVYSIKQTWTDGLGNTFQVESQLELLAPAAYVDDLFSTVLYEGTSDPRTIENGINLSGEGGLVWVKNRTAGYEHSLFDTERGVGKYLVSSANYPETTNTTRLSAFNSDGFSLGNDPMTSDYENDFVSWTFRKAPGFLDIQTYTGTGVAHDIAHNLGSVPGMIIIKQTGSERQWFIYHRGMGAYNNINLDSVFGQQGGSTVWNNTDPTATHFTVGTGPGVNNNGGQYVAYIFAHDDQSFGANGDEAIIKCGTYTGTGGSGLNVDLGFEAQFVLVKNINNNGSNWIIFDNMRGMDDGRRIQIYPNSAEAEFTGLQSSIPGLVATATGFKTDLGNSWFNQSGSTHIYMAIRRSHKPPTVGTDVFATDLFTGSTPNYISNFPVDFVINREGRENAGNGYYVADRLRGGKFLKAQAENAERGAPAATFDHMNGFSSDPGAANTDKIAWMFKRASGFMDMVAYTGTGSARTLSHNLDVAPELMIVKARDRAESWPVYISSVGETGALYLNSAGDVDTGNYYWNDTAPTAQEFSLGNLSALNRNGTKYIAYLFSTLPGVSKIGSYTGTGYQIDVDCGFTTAARFLMIKRKSGSGDWYVWDTERGLFGPPEPYLALNSTNAEVTGYDYVDPHSTGFTVTSTAPAEINAAGEEYVFLAIA